MVIIYILKLKYNKWHVGKTYRPIKDRVLEHFENAGSVWTKKYKPVSVEEIIEDADEFDEDKYTKKYMARYGIRNVRGGSYVTLTLNDSQLQCLTRELQSSTNSCFRCGKQGHFIKTCPEENDDDTNTDTDDTDDTNEKDPMNKPKNVTCDRCGRNSHTKEQCYANTDIHGKNLNIGNHEECQCRIL